MNVREYWKTLKDGHTSIYRMNPHVKYPHEEDPRFLPYFSSVYTYE